jgi:PAS domain-containing protein
MSVQAVRRGEESGMTGPRVDFEDVFRQLPIPVLLLTPDFDIADMNLAYLQVAGRTREELLGRNVFEAFPDNPSDPSASGVRDLGESLRRVLATGDPDTLAFQQYDVEVPGRPGVFAQRYWCPVNAPIFGTDGRVALLAQCVEEITEKVRRFVAGLAEGRSQERQE